MLELLWLLLPVAAASGWWAARREQERERSRRVDDRRAEYFRGLNYLLDEKPDRAIEVFGRLVEADPDTVEAQLTLGSLFRRRGEVDRAIHLHADLLSRPEIGGSVRGRARLELAEDYLKAGLFDRAETLLLELVDDAEHRPVALVRLLSIYEQERDWRKAIEYCDRVEQATGAPKRLAASHFCCELAEEALAARDAPGAQAWLARALELHPQCARAAMLRARIAVEAGEHRTALEDYQRVVRLSPHYLPEIVAPLRACYRALGLDAEWLACLRELAQRDPSGCVVGALAEALREQHGAAAALAFLETEVPTNPSMQGLRRLIDLKLAVGQPVRADELEALHRIGQRLLERSPRYRCDNCGFAAKALHWQCPSCKAWSAVKPVPDRVPRTA